MLDTEQMLKQIVGAENVSSNGAILEAYRFVAMGQGMPVSARPDIVVMPSNEHRVSRILSLANCLRLPVVTRGQGTGFQGENVPLEGGIMMERKCAAALTSSTPAAWAGLGAASISHPEMF